MPDFLLPDLGEGLDEAEVVAWRVKPGDRVAIDEVIAEVETAKAVVEVPVPYAGVVAALHAKPGTTVSVGQPLITITTDEPAGFHEPGVVVPDARAGGEEGSGSVLIGYGTTAAPARSRRGRRRATPGADPQLDAAGRVAVISPLVRKEARDAGLDLAGLTGTGPAGLVRRQDVRQAIAELASPRSPAAAGPQAEPGERRIPLSGARRAAADRLSRSRREIPRRPSGWMSTRPPWPKRGGR
jgi:2-oxoisovalerate dehydrogenase E2 component (dihydrolipoyl transacylase)